MKKSALRVKEGDIFLKEHCDRFEFDLNLLILFRLLPLNAILLTNPKEKVFHCVMGQGF
jgi:hypothetical protein